jgi:hypothetical protein
MDYSYSYLNDWSLVRFLENNFKLHILMNRTSLVQIFQEVSEEIVLNNLFLK